MMIEGSKSFKNSFRSLLCNISYIKISKTRYNVKAHYLVMSLQGVPMRRLITTLVATVFLCPLLLRCCLTLAEKVLRHCSRCCNFRWRVFWQATAVQLFLLQLLLLLLLLQMLLLLLLPVHRAVHETGQDEDFSLQPSHILLKENSSHLTVSSPASGVEKNNKNPKIKAYFFYYIVLLYHSTFQKTRPRSPCFWMGGQCLINTGDF
jgi:hypothetical protein